MNVEYLDLADYVGIASAVTGLEEAVITRIANLDLADSALHAPSAGFGGDDFYPDFVDKAAVLVVQSGCARGSPEPRPPERARGRAQEDVRSGVVTLDTPTSRHRAEVPMTAEQVPVHHLSHQRGSYGVDAPYVPVILLGVAVLSLVAAARTGQWLSWAPAIVLFGACGLLYLYTTLRGKFVVWRRLAEGLALKGDEEVLDVGCGRGMVTTTIASHLTSGHVTGIDIWSSHDQSGNSMEVTQHNAELEGVADRVRLETGDMREMPFGEATFDVVVTNAAIHNLKHAEDRATALGEMWRVTRPGGRFVLADIHHTAQYEQVLRDLGATDVRRRSAGWQGWFGNPFYATKVVEATR